MKIVDAGYEIFDPIDGRSSSGNCYDEPLCGKP